MKLPEGEAFREFFLSKAFASVVTILVTYFFSEDAARISGMGVQWAQELMGGGVAAGIGLLLWSKAGSVKHKLESKKELKEARSTTRTLSQRIDDLETALPNRTTSGKFAKARTTKSSVREKPT